MIEEGRAAALRMVAWSTNGARTAGDPLLSVHGAGCVEVRWIDLDRWREDLLRAADCLSAEERQRVEHIHGERLRDRVCGADVFRRTCLAAAAGCRPGDLEFARGRWGKPALVRGPAQLEFSLAHSQERAVIAIGEAVRVGVDVERVQPDFPWDQVSPRFLRAEERRHFERLPAPERARGYHQQWTRKEAAAKADGAGLTMDVRAVDVGPTELDPAREWMQTETPQGRWWLFDLPMPLPWVGSLAVERIAADHRPPRVRAERPGAGRGHHA